VKNHYVGHGRHWHFLTLAGYSRAQMVSVIAQAHRTSVEAAAPIFETAEVSLRCDRTGALGVGMLLRGAACASAFPYVDKGHVWPLEVHEQYEWPGGIEGQVYGSCHEAAIGLFDAHYAQNRDRYRRSAGPFLFQVDALAYSVWGVEAAESPDFATGVKAYMPVSDQEDYVASLDEIQFLSVVETVRSAVSFGLRFDVYTMTIALPAGSDGFSMRLNLYTPPHAEPHTFSVGDRIGGVCWLFGHLA
jgi:hypothetical protein